MRENFKRMNIRNYPPSISIIVPMYNEEESIKTLVYGLKSVMENYGNQFEIILIDDGSSDKTGEITKELAVGFDFLKVFHHSVNKGKTAAIKTGLRYSSGEILVLIDADLQYEPKDIPKLIELINEGFDVVNGWRDRRKDPITKKFSSRTYNFLTRKLFGVKIHDYNSGLKAFKREALKKMPLLKGQHRYMLVLAKHCNLRIGEIKVQHCERTYGKSKYGIKRLFCGITDLMVLRLELTFMERPMLLFGGLGLLMITLGVALMIYQLILQVAYAIPFHIRPLLLLSTSFIIAGVQFFSLGFLADILTVLREELRSLREKSQAIMK